MMIDSVEGEMSNGGGTGKQARAAELGDQGRRAAYAHARAYAHAQTYAHLHTYVTLAVKGSGLLALLLSTVILLGGYVQSLGKKDFFCIMAITVIQAAGIFQDWNTSLKYLNAFLQIYFSAQDLLLAHIPALALVQLPSVVLILCVMLFYLVGPLACAAISSWRIEKLNHGNNRDANMMAALNIFYSLIIFQGTMFLVLLLPMRIYRANMVNRLHLEQLSEEWGENAIRRYISDIIRKCRKDPISIEGRDLIKYGAELLDSESQEDYLYGARLLSTFVKKGEDVSWVLLPSTHRIQRLIDSLMISSSSSGRHLDEAFVQLKSQYRHGRCYTVIGSSIEDKKEIRELAATIMANVAAHIDDLSNYPGAMRCISSLLQHQEESTQATHPPPHQRPIGPLTKREHHQEKRMQRLIRLDERWHMNLMRDQNRMEIKEHQHRNKREGGTTNVLVQQGLTILERLASNSDDNRKLICDVPGLLSKIKAPIHSATLTEDVKTKAWADIVTRCLKVLYQLIGGPDGSHEIFSDVQALINLKSILEMGNTEADHQELQLIAMQILTELALNESINLTEETKKVLITKQMQLFLFANRYDEEEESATIAGRAMVSLSTNSENNSALIMTTETGIIGLLTGILDDFLITRRTIAAEIMANLCAHRTVDNTMKEILLPNVLREILSIKIKTQKTKASTDQKKPALGDEEQGNSTSTKKPEERNKISTKGNDTETEEVSDEEREEQEAFLSLAQVICDKLNCADLDDAIQKAVDQNNAGNDKQRREAFVDKLKTIVDGNCSPAADSLRIVKLCGQIAKSVMRCEQYVEIFRNKGFKISLSEASKTMSELESCMRFVGTDFGLKKTVRPLFSEIEKSFSQI